MGNAYGNGLNARGLLDEITKVTNEAVDVLREGGEEAGEEFVEGVVKGIKKHSKDAKSEVTKLFEDFNKTTNNFKRKDVITQAEWTRVLGLSKELMKSERYADSVREKLSDISVTLKNGMKVSGLEKVLEEWSKVGGLVESVQWAEAGKNYRKKPSTKKPKVETPVIQADPAPVVKAEEKKQEAIEDTTAAIVKQGEAIDNVVKQMPKMESIIKRFKKLITRDVMGLIEAGDFEKMTKGWGIADMIKEAKLTLDHYHGNDTTQGMLQDEDPKQWKSDVGKLKRFIAAYEPYVGVIKTTVGEVQQAAVVTEKQTEALREQEAAVESASVATEQYIKAQEKLAEVQSKLKSGSEHTSFQRGGIYSGREGRLTLARRIGSDLSKFDLSSDEIDKLVDSTYEQFSKVKNLLVDKQEWNSMIKGTIRENSFGKQFNQLFSVDILNQLRQLQEFGEIIDQVHGGLISVSDAMRKTSDLVDRTIKPRKEATQALHEQKVAAEGAAQAQERINNTRQSDQQQIESNQKLISSYEGLAEAVEEFVNIRNKQKLGNDDYWELDHLKFEQLKRIESFIPEGTDAHDSIYNDLGYRLNRKEAKTGKATSADQILKFVEQKIAEAKKPSQQLFDTESGQLAFIEGVKESIKVENELQKELKETNEILEGQISIEDHIATAGQANKASEERLNVEKQITAEKERQQDIAQASEKDLNLVYHAGVLSSLDKTQKSRVLGNVEPYRNGDHNLLTGLYTTQDLGTLWANEWSGAPISTIDVSKYKLFDARDDNVASKAKSFFENLNATIYGYQRYFDYDEALDEDPLKTTTNVKSIEDLYVEFKEVFKDVNLDIQQFSDFIEKSRAIVAGHDFKDVEIPNIDEGIAKSFASVVLQGVSKEVFNSDSFPTQLMKMLGYEGFDVRGGYYDNTYTGGSVLFDVKPESLKTVDEKWSDVMARNGYEIDETALEHEEKRRQLAFETAEYYSRQVDAVKDVAEESVKVQTDTEVQNKALQEKKLAHEIVATEDARVKIPVEPVVEPGAVKEEITPDAPVEVPVEPVVVTGDTPSVVKTETEIDPQVGTSVAKPKDTDTSSDIAETQELLEARQKLNQAIDEYNAALDKRSQLYDEYDKAYEHGASDDELRSISSRICDAIEDITTLRNNLETAADAYRDLGAYFASPYTNGHVPNVDATVFDGSERMQSYVGDLRTKYKNNIDNNPYIHTKNVQKMIDDVRQSGGSLTELLRSLAGYFKNVKNELFDTSLEGLAENMPALQDLGHSGSLVRELFKSSSTKEKKEYISSVFSYYAHLHQEQLSTDDGINEAFEYLLNGNFSVQEAPYLTELPNGLTSFGNFAVELLSGEKETFSIYDILKKTTPLLVEYCKAVKEYRAGWNDDSKVRAETLAGEINDIMSPYGYGRLNMSIDHDDPLKAFYDAFGQTPFSMLKGPVLSEAFQEFLHLTYSDHESLGITPDLINKFFENHRNEFIHPDDTLKDTRNLMLGNISRTVDTRPDTNKHLKIALEGHKKAKEEYALGIYHEKVEEELERLGLKDERDELKKQAFQAWNDLKKQNLSDQAYNDKYDELVRPRLNRIDEIYAQVEPAIERYAAEYKAQEAAIQKWYESELAKLEIGQDNVVKDGKTDALQSDIKKDTDVASDVAKQTAGVLQEVAVDTADVAGEIDSTTDVKEKKQQTVKVSDVEIDPQIIFDTENGQLSLFEGLSSSAKEATDNVEELEDAVKRAYNLDGQISFDDLRREEAKQVGAVPSDLQMGGVSPASENPVIATDSLTDADMVMQKVEDSASDAAASLDKVVDSGAYDNLIENENKYQQELEETARIQKERDKQLDAFSYAAVPFMGDDKYEVVSGNDKTKLFESFVNKIAEDGMSASDAMDQLYLSMEALRKQSEAMPDNIGVDYSAEVQKLEAHVNNLGEEFKNSEQYRDNFNILVDGIKSGSISAAQAMDKMSDAYEKWSIELVGSEPKEDKNLLDIVANKNDPRVANAFKGMDIKKWINGNVQKDARDELEGELYKLAQTIVDEDNDAYNAQLAHIADFIVANFKSREPKEADPYESVFSDLLVTYTDEDAAAMGEQLFEKAKKILGKKFQKKTEKYKNADSIDQFIKGLITNGQSSLFSDPHGQESDYNKFNEFLDQFDHWKQEGNRKTRDNYLSDSDAPGIVEDFNETMRDQMVANIEEQQAILDAKTEAAQATTDDLNKAFQNVKQASSRAVLKGTTKKDFEDFARQIANDSGMELGTVAVSRDSMNQMQLATIKLLNKELAQSITYTYDIQENADGINEAFLRSSYAVGDANKALDNARKKEEQDAKKKLQNDTWLYAQRGKLDTQQRRYTDPDRGIDGKLSIMSTETSLAEDAEHTIESLSNHIRENIKKSLSSGLTDEVKRKIISDLEILENEIKVRQQEQYSSTTMKSSQFETNKKAYQEYMRAFTARAQKSGVFPRMAETINELNAELNSVSDAKGFSKFVDNFKIARNKFQAETAALARDTKTLQTQLSTLNGEENAYRKIGANVRSVGPDNLGDSFKQKIASYESALRDLRAAMDALKSDPIDASGNLHRAFDDAALKAKNARVEIEGIFKESQKLDQISKNTLIKTHTLNPNELQNLQQAMLSFAASVEDGTFKFNGFNKAGTEMYGTLKQSGGAIKNVTVALKSSSDQLYMYGTNASKASDEWDNFSTTLASGAKNLIGMYVGFQEGVQAVRTGLNYVKEIDLAMTELKKVTDETDASYKQFLNDAGSTSAVIGSTISDFTEATATFARLGYSMEESSSMAETAIIYKNVADGLDSVEESSESIISTMMAFGIEANDTMSIIDRFNAVGKYIAQAM